MLVTFPLSYWTDMPRTPPQQPYLLIVEDDPDLSSVLCVLLDVTGGADQFTVSTTQEAIQAYEQSTPALILLDLNLIGEDGTVFIEWIRQQPGSSTLPIIIYTARDISEPEWQQLQLGNTHFFIKSRIEPVEFRNRVLALLNQPR